MLLVFCGLRFLEGLVQAWPRSFWSWWDCARKVEAVFPLMGKFLAEATRRQLAKKNVAKMVHLFEEKIELQAEMRFVISFGKVFHAAGFELEGDGFCLPFAQFHISRIREQLAVFSQDRLGFSQIVAVREWAREAGAKAMTLDTLPQRFFNLGLCVKNHFEEAVMRKMSDKLNLFRFAGLFHPARFVRERSREGFLENVLFPARALWTELKGVKGKVSCLDLEVEYQDFIRLSKEENDALIGSPEKDTPSLL
jgi:hypothetical protein